MNLIEVFNKQKFDTDKYDLGYIKNFYDDFLSVFKNVPINFLEIGIAKCGSIKLWKEFFDKESNIFAGDISISASCNSDVNYIIGDCYSDEIINSFENNFFDLIIDDGPHTFHSFQILINKYYCKIKKNGYLIVEDIIEKKWVEPLINLAKEIGYEKCDVIDMTNKQETEFLLNRWKNGLFILKLQK